MLEQSLGILFYQKKRTGSQESRIPIYMRVTVNGSRIEIGTKQSCEQDRWNSHAQRVKGTNETSRSINAMLDTLERKVHDARRILLDAQKSITAENLKKVLIGQSERPKMLMEVFGLHNKQMQALAGREYSPATVTRYETTAEHVRSFLKATYNVSDIDIKSLTYSFASDFEFYLKSVRKCNHNSAIKYVGNMRKIVNYCIKSGWLVKDPFFGYKMAKREEPPKFL